MTDFWSNYKDITDQVLILYIISVIQYYTDIYYHKILFQICNFFRKQYIKSLI